MSRFFTVFVLVAVGCMFVTSPLSAGKVKKYQSTYRNPEAFREFSIKVKKAELLDVVNQLAKVAGINVLCSRDVRGKIDLELADVDPFIALKALAAANRLMVVEYSKSHRLYLVVREGESVYPYKSTHYRGKKLSVDFEKVDLKEPFQVLARTAKINLVYTKDVAGKVTFKLKDVPALVAIHALAAVNRLSVNLFDHASKLYIVGRKGDFSKIRK